MKKKFILLTIIALVGCSSINDIDVSSSQTISSNSYSNELSLSTESSWVNSNMSIDNTSSSEYTLNDSSIDSESSYFSNLEISTSESQTDSGSSSDSSSSEESSSASSNISSSDSSSSSESEPDINQHLHIYNKKYIYDENYHWNSSICGHDVRNNYRPHMYRYGVCIDCGYNYQTNKYLTFENIGDGYTVSDCSSETTDITIPYYYNNLPVVGISNEAFRNCDFLTSIVISDSVTTIGEDAFYSCNSLISIVIPDSVTTIGEYAFAFCDSLTIYCEATSQPSGWDSYWNENGGIVSYYSENEPQMEGNYWHYDNNGETIIVW